MIRLLLATGIAALVTLVGTRLLIGALTRRHIGQPIHEDVPEGHTVKAGTPTMGGVAIVAGGLCGYLASNLYDGVFTWTGLATMGAIAGAGTVGFLDDWIKIRNERNLGLNKRSKTLGLLLVAVGFALVILWRTNVHTTISFGRFDDLGWTLGKWVWVAWAVLVIFASSNAVNLTDGLDGLAAGSAIFVFSAYVIIGYWIFRHPGMYQINVGLDLAVVAAAMMGACAGFLWWNAAPAQIFMGDTGSLAIGTGLAALALSSSTVVLLPILGLLFVMETVSVIVQVASFRTTGRRVFRMAPIHHHFELGGWPETTVIIRGWMLTGATTAIGLGLFYREFIRAGGLA
ncbi:MAG TPA: phospho-N-acetylmuramoyl-pentapeptide-transferase [Microthrixaceae bacterium]|nr:phospho-N-acetylmuramoyl-pentapeptide-transferase [Microthrixaceae bacterium]